jgi:hypothetical protein
MAYYYSLRGWLETEPNNLPQIINLIETMKRNYQEQPQKLLYLQGWQWQAQRINWTTYIFYGADVTIEGLNLFEIILNQLTSLSLDLSGYFEAKGEDEEQTLTYKINDDLIKKITEKALVTV